MKPSIKKIIKYDYISTFLFIIAAVVTLLFIAILFSKVTGVMGIIIPAFLVSVTLLILRIITTRNSIYKLKDSRVKAIVHRIDKTRGKVFIVVNYEVNTRSLGKRIPVLAGPILKNRLSKLKEVELLVDVNKPQRIFIADFYY